MTLDELEEIANNATQGTWTCSCRHVSGPPENDLSGISKWPDEEWLGCEVQGPKEPPGRGQFVGRDAAFITAFQPGTVLELIRLARLRQTPPNS